MVRIALCVLGCLCLGPATLAAQQADIRIAFEGGRVTIDATNSLLSDVLHEWGRVGGTRVAGADQLPPSRLTISLEAVYEDRALAALLGPTTGYAATIRSDVPAGGSVMSRILIAPPSAVAPAAGRQPSDADASMPEGRFSYADPATTLRDDADSLLPGVRASRPPAAGETPWSADPLVDPEVRFSYAGPATTLGDDADSLLRGQSTSRPPAVPGTQARGELLLAPEARFSYAAPATMASDDQDSLLHGQPAIRPPSAPGTRAPEPLVAPEARFHYVQPAVPPSAPGSDPAADAKEKQVKKASVR